jgi:hypothetical protein
MDMSDIDRSIEFLASLDNGFPGRIRGAAEGDIQRFEELTGHPAMPEHRAFLDRLGEDNGGIDLGDFGTGVRDLITVLEGTTGKSPANMELFAVGLDDNDADLFLAPNAGAAGIVEHASLYGENWQAFDSDYALPVASSISEYLCSAALRTMRMSRKPRRELYMQSDEEPGAIETLGAKLQELGFERLWFSTPNLVAAERGSIDLLARQRPGVPLNFEIAGKTEDKIAEVIGAIGSVLHLERET